MHIVYLHGVAGGPELSPALRAVEDAGVTVHAPVLPGFDGRSGWEPPADHLGWLVAAWDALDATGALPCPVVAASSGGMLAADLAVLRPEAVTKLALLGPLGLWDSEHPGADPWALPGAQRYELMFADGVPAPFRDAFADRGVAEQQVAQYVVQMAGASIMWPLPDRGLARRLHRLRAEALVVWGADDRVVPVELAKRWPASEVVTVDGGGHLVEWDRPEEVAAPLRRFLGV